LAIHEASIALALWFLPPTIVSIMMHEYKYLWLDALTNWSILDIFVLVITLASKGMFMFCTHSNMGACKQFDSNLLFLFGNIPDISFLPSDFCALGMLVIPK